jgi:hypothetical protein
MTCQVISFEYQKLLKSYDKISSAIIDYINDMGLVWEVEMAQRVYFGSCMVSSDSRKDNLSYKPFIQWLIFSYKLNTGRSLIECIYEQYTNRMISYERDTLSMLRNTHEGLYKLYSAKSDIIQLKDVFSGELLSVWDSNLGHVMKRYDGLFMRIVSIHNKNIPIPGYQVMTNSMLKETESFIREKYNKYKSFYNEISINSFVNLNSLMIHKYFLQFNI